MPAGPAPSTTGLLGDIFGLTSAPTMYTPAKVCWLPAEKGKGLEIVGMFSRRSGQMSMDLTLTNKAMQVINKSNCVDLVMFRSFLCRP